MGFFQELKEDLSQAVNELVPEDGTQQDKQDNMSEAGENLMYKEEETVSEEIPEESFQSGSDSLYTEVTAAKDNRTFLSQESQDNQEDKEDDAETTDEVSSITRGMKINGDVETSGSLDLVGVIVGNIKIRGKLNVTGGITGNAQAAEVYAQDARIKGDVTSLGSVKIGNNSVIRGNIFATSAVIAGAVKGDIDVKGPVILDASAIVMGNIKSKSVQINNGAVIEGLCSQCYAEVSPSSFFKE